MAEVRGTGSSSPSTTQEARVVGAVIDTEYSVATAGVTTLNHGIQVGHRLGKDKRCLDTDRGIRSQGVVGECYRCQLCPWHHIGLAIDRDSQPAQGVLEQVIGQRYRRAKLILKQPILNRDDSRATAPEGCGATGIRVDCESYLVAHVRYRATGGIGQPPLVVDYLRHLTHP